MRIAIIVDWLTTRAGAERVLEQILICYPTADLFAIVDFIPDGERQWLLNKKVTTSFIQKLPFAKKKYRAYLPLMPFAIEQFDLSQYELIISTSHAVAKGVIVGPKQLHISYIYSPMRYAWDLQQQYLTATGLQKGLKSLVIRYLLHRLRIWDVISANRVDHFLTLSNYIALRIEKCYRRSASVIYPPVGVHRFNLIVHKEDFYLTASRMVPYKKIPLIVEAFKKMPDKKLIVIGDGPEFGRVKKLQAPNIEILGYQSDEVLASYLGRAKAFVFAAEEDFGILPLEAQASGTPVIAFGRGGVCETVVPLGRPHPTGLFFEEQTVDALIGAIQIFEQHVFSPRDCRQQAEKFNEANFQKAFKHFVDGKIKIGF